MQPREPACDGELPARAPPAPGQRAPRVRVQCSRPHGRRTTPAASRRRAPVIAGGGGGRDDGGGGRGDTPHQSSTHLTRLRTGFSLELSPTRIASSNTFFSPVCVSALHSMYFTAPISAASFSPSGDWMGCRSFFRSSARISSSSRRSSLVPTSRNGTPAAWCLISITHLFFTESKDTGDTTEKHTRKTLVCGYESGRRRS
mmetsp:Transcript_15499/g.53844  ORF Transcript_15499/g.53844 Transcript_15499/m.53844 type:complete len:201 (+) Transcript_15499:139-741(+)